MPFTARQHLLPEAREIVIGRANPVETLPGILQKFFKIIPGESSSPILAQSPCNLQQDIRCTPRVEYRTEDRLCQSNRQACHHGIGNTIPPALQKRMVGQYEIRH